MSWVQLLQPRTIAANGVARTYYAGDWVDVGNQTARRWLADGVARVFDPSALAGDLRGCGLVAVEVMAVRDTDRPGRLTSVYKALPVQTAVEIPVTLPYARTLIWDTRLMLRPELVAVGLQLLTTWELAVPLASYDTLTLQVGTDEARTHTQAMLHDLRVPLYDPRLVFVRRCRAGEQFMALWHGERAREDDERLALLRALYAVKPLLCPLPVSWTAKAA